MADYYSDGDGPAPAPSKAPDRGEEREKPEEGKTALINSDICPGMKVGDEMVVKITGVHEGEYEVSYAPEPKDEGEGEGEGGPRSTGETMSEGMHETPMPGGGGGMYD